MTQGRQRRAGSRQDKQAIDWEKLVEIGTSLFGGLGSIRRGIADALEALAERFDHEPQGGGEPREDPGRDAILRSAEEHLRQGAIEVRADVAGWSRPKKLRGHIPDVYAKYRG